jgi:hypothetical protein
VALAQLSGLPTLSPDRARALIIRWGPEVSSDLLRRSARCTSCGHKGAILTHSSWAGLNVGFAPFPVEWV